MKAIKIYEVIGVLRPPSRPRDTDWETVTCITVRARSPLAARRVALEAAWQQGFVVSTFAKVEECENDST